MVIELNLSKLLSHEIILKTIDTTFFEGRIYMVVHPIQLHGKVGLISVYTLIFGHASCNVSILWDTNSNIQSVVDLASILWEVNFFIFE